MFLADDRGVLIGRSLKSAAGPADEAFEFSEPSDLVALADAATFIARVAKGARYVTVPTLGDVEGLDAHKTSAQAWVIDLPDHPDVAKRLPDAWLWKLHGVPGRLFASSAAPPSDDLVIPACAKDFPHVQVSKLEKRERQVRLLKGPDTAEQRLVMGIVLEPETVDSQNDIYSAAEIASAAHRYLEQFQNVGHMHQTMLPDTAVKVAESYLAPVDFEVQGQAVKAGTWIIVVHILSDGLWKQVKSGELTGFSIGGYAQRVPNQTGAGGDGTPTPVTSGQ